MGKLFVILFLLASISGVILYKKFPGNTKQGILLRFWWFIIVMAFSFIFLSENATLPQNIVLVFCTLSGVIYFYFKFKMFKQKARH